MNADSTFTRIISLRIKRQNYVSSFSLKRFRFNSRRPRRYFEKKQQIQYDFRREARGSSSQLLSKTGLKEY